MFSKLAKDKIVQKLTTLFYFTSFMLQFYINIKKYLVQKVVMLFLLLYYILY